MELSVVIIARNEESTLARNLEALMPELRTLESEILLVDSASTDRTVSIAQAFPVRIVQLESDPLLSPAAGRFMGTLLSKGKFVFFLDGDMILMPGWLSKGLEEMRESTLAGVAGRLFFVRPGEDLSFDHPDTLPLGETRSFGGSAIYRKAALEQCGTFNPYVQGEEEAELGYRLRRGGYRLIRVAQPMAYHLDKVRGVRQIDIKARYNAGVGQILRRYPGSELARQLMRSSAPTFAKQLLALGTLATFLVALAAGWHALAVILVAAVALTLTVLALVKGPKRVLLYVRAIALISYHMGRGFAGGIPDGAGFEKRIRYTISEAKPA